MHNYQQCSLLPLARKDAVGVRFVLTLETMAEIRGEVWFGLCGDCLILRIVEPRRNLVIGDSSETFMSIATTC